MKTLIVWYNPNKDIYYHRIINGSYIEQNYCLGAKNSYGHEIVHKIDGFDFYKKKIPIKKRVVRKTIKILRKFE